MPADANSICITRAGARCVTRPNSPPCSTFGSALPRIRRRVERHICSRGLPREKILAAVVRLMERTLGRVGNPEYAKQNDSFGLTTLRRDHVRISGGNIELDFRGKHGVHQHKVVTDPTLARILRRCHELPGSELFRYIVETGTLHRIYSEDVNAYLRDRSGHHITAKDFRTWAATMRWCRCARPSQASGRWRAWSSALPSSSATRRRSAARATSIRACSPLISMARSSQSRDDRGEHTRARALRRRRSGDAPAGGMDRCGQRDRRHARKPAAGEGAGELTEVMHGVRGIRQT